MQISLKWINELLKIDVIQLDDLIKKLTLGGFEVEEVLKFELNSQKQIVLDISATANRSDSLSIQGISIEIASLLNKPIKVSDYLYKFNNWNSIVKKFTNTITLESDYSIFLGVVVENLTNTTIPRWVKDKIIASGLTPSNNLLDFQNYILLETGYPFAFYDFDNICSKLNTSKFDLSISPTKNEKTFYASNDITYQLNDSILLVKANDTPISIGGIIEDKEFSYSKMTKSLLIEGSIFNAAKIRQQSRTLSLRTERSTRYEKSLKKTFLIEALYRLISLLRISNPNLTCKLHTSLKASEKVLKPITLHYQTIKEILGPIKSLNQDVYNYISPDEILKYLERLNLKFLYDKSKLIWKVNIPDSRIDDIEREIDLIEEIGRLHGFNNFLTTLPKINTIGKEDPSYIIKKKITSCLVSLGLNELIHYSLVDELTFFKNEIKLVNPLLSDSSNLRLSLLPNLVNTIQENLKQGNSFIEGFEYGHIFLKNSEKIFEEREYVAGIFGGIKTKLIWSDPGKVLSWFEAKGKIEQIFKQLNILVYYQNCSISYALKILHPYRSSEIYLSNGTQLGVFGQINPIIANKLNIPSEIYLFELNAELIEKQLQINKLAFYKKYSTYPKISKDLSIVSNKNILFNEIQTLIYYNGTEFLSEVNLLDEYRGPSIPNDCTSLCLQLKFQSTKGTLQNKQIDTIIQKLKIVLKQQLNVNFRE